MAKISRELQEMFLQKKEGMVKKRKMAKISLEGYVKMSLQNGKN